VTESAPDVSVVRVLNVSRDINLDHKPSHEVLHAGSPRTVLHERFPRRFSTRVPTEVLHDGSPRRFSTTVRLQRRHEHERGTLVGTPVKNRCGNEREEPPWERT
jgi:hypothetical protein